MAQMARLLGALLAFILPCPIGAVMSVSSGGRTDTLDYSMPAEPSGVAGKIMKRELVTPMEASNFHKTDVPRDPEELGDPEPGEPLLPAAALETPSMDLESSRKPAPVRRAAPEIVQGGSKLPLSISNAMFGIETWWYPNDVFRDRNRSSAIATIGFSSTPSQEWTLMVGTIGAAIAFDWVVQEHLHCYGWVGHVTMVFYWFFVAIAYWTHYARTYDRTLATEWMMGYFLELVLSIDNVFVFHLIFEYFRPPTKQQHKAVLFGAIGAILARLVLFAVLGSIAMRFIRWVRVLFGLLLMYSGIKAAREEEIQEMNDSRELAFIQSCLGSRLIQVWDPRGRIFISSEDGRFCATLLLPLIVCIEVTDVIFAIDSLSAKVAQIENQYVCFSSSAFAILALRSLFFVLRDVVEYCEYLKHGICVILIFIGLELIVADFVDLPASSLCGVILAIFLTSVAMSVFKGVRDQARSRLEEESSYTRGSSAAAEAALADEAQTPVDSDADSLAAQPVPGRGKTTPRSPTAKTAAPRSSGGQFREASTASSAAAEGAL